MSEDSYHAKQEQTYLHLASITQDKQQRCRYKDRAAFHALQRASSEQRR